jgi:FtsZ-interacting cell division protein ZipA
MSDLQILLIVIGALIIVAVLILNWWQERRFHQQVESSFSNLKSDALLDDPKLDVSKIYEDVDQFSHDENRRKDYVEEQVENQAEGYKPETQTSNHSDLDEIQPITFNEVITSVPTEQVVSAETHTHHDDYDSLSMDSIEEAYTEAVYTELEHKAHESARNDESKLAARHASPDVVDLKPAQHLEIKAIFDEAFSNVATPREPDTAEESKVVTNVTAINPESNANPASSFDEPVLILPAMLHAQMDLIAVFYLASESTVGSLKLMLGGLFDGYEKPVYVHLLDANKQWVLLQDVADKIELQNQPITRLSCSLQLADRAGAVSRNMLNRFQLAVESLGLDINAHVEWQSAGDALSAAKALDIFCIEVDKTMGFHLIHGENGAFTGTKLRGLAEAHGLALSEDGVFKYFDETVSKLVASQSISPRLPSFVMFNRDQHPFSPEMLRTSVVKGVTFQLDIPHVKHCAEAFNHMVQVARQMEIGLNAVLVDDNNRVLSDIQIEKIRQQLKVIHAKLLVKGIVPGSDSALRLFS